MNLQALATQLLTSTQVRDSRRFLSEFNNRLHGQHQRGECWLRIDDPYSWLLVQCIPELIKICDIQLQALIISRLPKQFYPEPKMLNDYALKDAQRLANLMGLEFFARDAFTEADKKQGSAMLLAAARQDDCWAALQRVFKVVWQQNDHDIRHLASELGRVDDASVQLSHNEKMLEKKGHYLSATIHYAGEWYWGLDRLAHLEQRLTGKMCRFIATQFEKPTGKKDAGKGKTLSLFFSFRSPYSYLLLERLFALVDYYAIDLQIRPVMPMVMRGLSVPRSKRMYIVLDAKREAECYGIPFGRICDPLGKGVERALAVYELAESGGKQREYLLSVARAVWAEGVDIASDSGLKSVCDRIALPWDVCCAALQGHDWQKWAESNRQAMYQLGCWGVPTMHMDDVVVWGQDRLWMIEQALNT